MIQREKPIPKSRTPIPRKARPKAVNVEATAKRKKRKASKYAKFRRSEGYKEAKARANGQCETLCLLDGVWEFRCAATEGLQVHHKTYRDFGGNETADQLEVLCKRCHEAKHAGKKVA